MKHFTKTILPILLILSVLSCQNYYKATKLNTNAEENIIQFVDSVKDTDRYLILRSGNKSFHINKIQLIDDKQIISTNLDTLPSVHQLHLNNGIGGEMKYKKRRLNGSVVLNEVHIYIDRDSINAGNYTFPLKKVQQIEVIKKDKRGSGGRTVSGVLFAATGAAGLYFLIVAAGIVLVASAIF